MILGLLEFYFCGIAWLWLFFYSYNILGIIYIEIVVQGHKRATVNVIGCRIESHSRKLNVSYFY